MERRLEENEKRWVAVNSWAWWTAMEAVFELRDSRKEIELQCIWL
jgi:hypothetical protein